VDNSLHRFVSLRKSGMMGFRKQQMGTISR